MKLRYVEIETDKIFNWLDPFNMQLIFIFFAGEFAIV